MNNLLIFENIIKIPLNLNMINHINYKNEIINYILVTPDTFIDFEEMKEDIQGEYIKIGFIETEEDKGLFENILFDCWISDLNKLEDLLTELNKGEK